MLFRLLSAILAGWFEAPVLFGSGDQAFAAEAGELVPGIEIAMVKLATGYYSGICFAPEKNQAAIEAGAKAAVERFSAGNGPKPFQVSVPATLEVSYAEPFSTFYIHSVHIECRHIFNSFNHGFL